MFEEKVKGSVGPHLVGHGVISEDFCKELRFNCVPGWEIVIA